MQIVAKNKSLKENSNFVHVNSSVKTIVPENKSYKSISLLNNFKWISLLNFVCLGILVGVVKSQKKQIFQMLIKTVESDFAPELFNSEYGRKMQSFLRTERIKENFNSYINVCKMLTGIALPLAALKVQYDGLGRFFKTRKNERTDIAWTTLNWFVIAGSVFYFKNELTNKHSLSVVKNNYLLRFWLEKSFITKILSNQKLGTFFVISANFAIIIFIAFLEFIFTYQMSVFFINLKNKAEECFFTNTESILIGKFISNKASIGASIVIMVIKLLTLISGILPQVEIAYSFFAIVALFSVTLGAQITQNYFARKITFQYCLDMNVDYEIKSKQTEKLPSVFMVIKDIISGQDTFLLSLIAWTVLQFALSSTLEDEKSKIIDFSINSGKEQLLRKIRSESSEKPCSILISLMEQIDWLSNYVYGKKFFEEKTTATMMRILCFQGNAKQAELKNLEMGIGFGLTSISSLFNESVMLFIDCAMQIAGYSFRKIKALVDSKKKNSGKEVVAIQKIDLIANTGYLLNISWLTFVVATIAPILIAGYWISDPNNLKVYSFFNFRISNFDLSLLLGCILQAITRLQKYQQLDLWKEQINNFIPRKNYKSIKNACDSFAAKVGKSLINSPLDSSAQSLYNFYSYKAAAFNASVPNNMNYYIPGVMLILSLALINNILFEKAIQKKVKEQKNTSAH